MKKREEKKKKERRKISLQIVRGERGLLVFPGYSE